MKRLVTFRIGDSRYALPAEQVTEAVEVDALDQRVLSAGGDGPGLARVRGRWVPVIELAGAVPGAEPLGRAASAVVVVLGQGQRQLGLRVQELGDVVAAGEGRTRTGSGSEMLLELDGELVRYIDPGLLLDSQVDLLGDEGGAMEDNQAAADTRQLVTFRVSDAEFAIDVMKALEVLKVSEVQSVPKAPAFVEGVVAVRDGVVPVIDMRKRFSLSARKERDPGRLLIVQAADTRVALVVDDVPGVVEFAADAVNPAPEFFRGLAGRYLEGIVRDGERLVILLNLDEILSSKERIALEKLTAEATGDGAKKRASAGKPKKPSGRRRKVDES